MLADALLQRRRALLAFVMAMTVAGVWAFRSLPRRLEPQIRSEVAAIELQLPGVSADEFELLLTRRVEEDLLSAPMVRDVRSQTRDGAAILLVTAAGDRNQRDAVFQGLDERLTRLREELAPQFLGLIGPRLRRPAAQNAELLLYVARKSDATVPDARPPQAPPTTDAQVLAGQLRRLAEVATVETVGAPDEQILLTYEDRDLSDARLAPARLRDYLRAQSFTAPGGYVTRDGAVLPIETAARLTSVAQLEQLAVRDPQDGRPVNLKRLVDIQRTTVEPAMEIVQHDGVPAICLGVVRADRVAIDRFANSVREVVTEFRGEHPDLACDVIVSQPELVNGELHRFHVNLAQSFVIILLLLVVVLGWRTGIAVAVVVPIVVFTSFILLRMGGLWLDLVTLSSLVLVLGMLVDNHIVIAERIHRLRQQGTDHRVAIRTALRELWAPLLAASATTVFGFLPVYLADHLVGEYVRALFWVVLISLSVSLVFCLCVTPMLLSEGRARTTQPARPKPTLYAAVVRALCRASLPLLLLIAAACAFGIDYLMHAERVFFPAPSRPLWMLQVEHPHGTESRGTERANAGLDAFLRTEATLPEGGVLAEWTTFIGRTAPAFQASLPVQRFAPHYAQILLGLRDGVDPAPFAQRLHDWMAAQTDGVRRRLHPIRLGAQLDWPIEVTLMGPETDLPAAAERVADHLRGLDCRDVTFDRGSPVRKVRLLPDRTKLAERNLSAADLTLAMHSVLHGLPVFEMAIDGQHLPVMLKAKTRRKDQLEALKDAYVYPEKGEASVLYEVSDVTFVEAAPVKSRRTGQPSLSVLAEANDPGRELAVGAELSHWLPELSAEFPAVAFQIGGAFDAERRATSALLEEMPWALLLVLLFLLLQSQSVRETLLILLCIPVSFTGVAIGMIALDQPFTFMTLVGMTALAGLVVNNAIVLIASMRRSFDDHQPGGAPLLDGLIQSAEERFRPILLTTLCAITSMVVLYQSGGPMWQPLATTIISGLSISTLFVLFVLPALYTGARRVRAARPESTPPA